MACGQFVNVSDERTISVTVDMELTDPDDGKTVNFFGDFDSASPAAPFMPFTDIAFARAEDPPINWGQASGGQLSTASATLLKGEGQTASEGALGFAIPPSFMNTSGISLYLVRFDVSEHTLVQLSGSMETVSESQGAGTFGAARIRLSLDDGGPLQPIVSVTIQSVMTAQVDQTLRLAPGSYVLEYLAQSGVFSASGAAPLTTASFDAELAFAGTMCNEADLSAPFGSLDFSDVVAFLVAFGAAGQTADLAEPFGVFDFSDVVVFLDRFASGCP